MPSDYYVYVYLDTNNVPFYVGKGFGRRYKIMMHTSQTNKLLQNKIKKLGQENIVIQFIKTNMSEQDAFNCEKYWIKVIGRRDLGLGPLCNMTGGGEGESGRKPSKETLAKRLASNIASYKNTDRALKISKTLIGHVVTEETKRKISKANKGRTVWNKGRKATKEERDKNSRAQLGKKLSESHKKKISLNNLGKKKKRRQDATNLS